MGPSTWELLFKILVGALGAMGAAILKTTWDEIRSLRAARDADQKDQTAFRATLPEIYARRDDVRDGFDRIEGTLGRIEQKLDRKVDRA